MNAPLTPDANRALFEQYLRLRGIHPDQLKARKEKLRAKGRAAKKARKRNR